MKRSRPTNAPAMGHISQDCHQQNIDGASSGGGGWRQNQGFDGQQQQQESSQWGQHRHHQGPMADTATAGWPPQYPSGNQMTMLSEPIDTAASNHYQNTVRNENSRSSWGGAAGSSGGGGWDSNQNDMMMQQASQQQQQHATSKRKRMRATKRRLRQPLSGPAGIWFSVRGPPMRKIARPA